MVFSTSQSSLTEFLSSYGVKYAACILTCNAFSRLEPAPVRVAVYWLFYAPCRESQNYPTYFHGSVHLSKLYYAYGKL